MVVLKTKEMLFPLPLPKTFPIPATHAHSTQSTYYPVCGDHNNVAWIPAALGRRAGTAAQRQPWQVGPGPGREKPVPVPLDGHGGLVGPAEVPVVPSSSQPAISWAMTLVPGVWTGQRGQVTLVGLIWTGTQQQVWPDWGQWP